MERLTKKDLFKLNNMYLYEKQLDWSSIYTKLGTLEDVMEKFGIESVEDLEDTIKNVERLLIKATQCKRLNRQIDKLTKDRDTWKKACELAIKEGEYITDHEVDRPFPNCDYFYQQAKEKKND